ncbi:MAG TPA: hypothetical protein VFN38_06535 [Gemmatimonadaceae bacterium]|nr:hypothetical protein [Gemmatimonadaceae bacterium]
MILLTEQIADRIRPLCQGMPETELQALAAGMARVEHKYATAESPRYGYPFPAVPSPLAPVVRIS